MYTIKQILQQSSERPWQHPSKKYAYYQEWNKALFFHYKVDPSHLVELLPKDLELDLYQGQAWISIVPFTMQKIRPRFLPALSWVSDFEEINLRTYVIKDGKPGVYFLNIEAGKRHSAFLAKTLSGLPYQYSKIKRNSVDYFQGRFAPKNFSIDVKYTVGAPVVSKTDLDLFLTERYCLYVDHKAKLYRYEIHHLPWEIRTLHPLNLDISYRIGAVTLERQPDLMHYSPGVQVVAWSKELL